jgi:hypothetical protein
MMSKLRKATGSDCMRLLHWCPGCNEVHSYRIDAPTRPSWTFDGNWEKPTLMPSMRIFVTETEDDNEHLLPHPIERTLCHYFIKSGKIEFCGDSPHALKGQTVDLPDWPYAPGTFGGIDEEKA